MVEKIYTKQEIDQINIGRSATDGLWYTDVSGNSYVGTATGNLKLLQNALFTPFLETSTIKETNVQKAIESLSKHKQVEIDFGYDLYQTQKIFNIIDEDAVFGAQIMACLAYEAPTGKDIDELEMDEMLFKCKANNGSIDIIATSLYGAVYGTFKINYKINF